MCVCPDRLFVQTSSSHGITQDHKANEMLLFFIMLLALLLTFVKAVLLIFLIEILSLFPNYLFLLILFLLNLTTDISDIVT